MPAVPTIRERLTDLLATVGLGAVLRQARRLRHAARLPGLGIDGHVPGWRYRRWLRQEKLCAPAGFSGIAVATLQNAAGADGDFVAIVAPGDQLAPNALGEIARAIAAQPHADFLYSDEDEIDDAGRRQRPQFKPNWSPDYLRATNYIGGLTIVRRDLLRNIGAVRTEYELALKAGEQARHVVHIPHVLYHRRQAVDKSRDLEFLREHLGRLNWNAEVSPREQAGTFRIRYRHTLRPRVSIIIPNCDQPQMLAACLRSVAENNYENVELIVVENGSRDAATFALYGQWKPHPSFRLLKWEGPFNYAAVNNFAASTATGELLLFLNNDIEATRPDWLERLVELALLPGVGVVGAKLLYPGGAIQHAGVVIGMHGVAGHPHRFFPAGHPGYCGRLHLPQNVAAVTGACLLISREVFGQAGGFDEGFALAYNDIDLCLAALRLGYRNIWTPDALLIHHESMTRGEDESGPARARLRREADRLREKWPEIMADGDPYFSPHFDLGRTDFCLR